MVLELEPYFPTVWSLICKKFQEVDNKESNRSIVKAWIWIHFHEKLCRSESDKTTKFLKTCTTYHRHDLLQYLCTTCLNKLNALTVFKHYFRDHFSRVGSGLTLGWPGLKDPGPAKWRGSGWQFLFDLGVEDVVCGPLLLPLLAGEDLAVSQGPGHKLDPHWRGQEDSHMVRPFTQDTGKLHSSRLWQNNFN
jgi:hypothetical protein